MKIYLITLVLLATTLFSCTTISGTRTWTINETQEWYKNYYLEQPGQPRKSISPLYYKGSDDEFHYFVSRSMDEWVFIKIRSEDLTITDVRAVTSEPYGYYPVNPLDNFKKIENHPQ